MNESSLHLELIKLYLLYFESGNQYEDTGTRASYIRTIRYLKEIEKIAKNRRMEIRNKYKSTDEYKKLRDTSIAKNVAILRAKFGDQPRRKK